MEKYWLKKEGHPSLVIYALGWASDYHAVEHIPCDGCDTLCLSDYRTLDPISPDEVAGYRNIYLFAWSFGVWAAEQLLQEIPLHRAVALNGTPLPYHDQLGIPPRALQVTLPGLLEKGTEAFNRRTFGNCYERMLPYLETRPFEEKYDELIALIEGASKPYTPTLRWDKAIIGRQDVIFPPANLRAYWGEQAVEADLPHYPFGDPDLILRELHDNR